MNKLLYYIALINTTITFGQEFQFAIIKDKDGFVNVRSSKEIKNNISDKLENGFIVTHFGQEGNWILIDYQKNGNDLNGYVYKDRLKAITDFTQIHKRKIIKNGIKLSNTKIEVIITEKQFSKENHELKYNKSYPTILDKIDEKVIFGTDGTLPNREYNSISITIDSQKITLPKEALENLFEPNFESTRANYDETTETLYLQSLNGDGAGGYAVMWLIEKGKYKKRITTIPF